MEKKNSNYYYMKMPDKNIYVDVIKKELDGPGPILYCHWHEHIQFYYVTEGYGFMICNSKRFDIHPNDFVVVNSNELHYMESLSDSFSCYIIRVDFSFLNSSQVDNCQTRYLAPLSNNSIFFHNLIRGNEQITACIKDIIEEFITNRYGYELAIKSDLYRLIVLLLRSYIDCHLSKKESDKGPIVPNRMHQVLVYIDANFTSKTTIHDLAEIACLSDYHFCKLFKQAVGRSAIEYINMLRVNKAMQLLQGGYHNVTEVALACGFSDSNYFSRIFKKYRGISPKAFLSK